MPLNPDPIVGLPGAVTCSFWVDPIAGSDANVGTSPDQPIATLDRLNAILGLQIVPNNGACYVYMAAGEFPVPPSGAFDLCSTVQNCTGEGAVYYKGTRTYVGGARTDTPAGATATVVASLSWDGATFQEGVVTCSGVDFSQYNVDRGYFAEIVGGDRDGLSYPVYWSSAIPSLAADVNMFKTAGPGAPADDLANAPTTMPQPGDVMRVYSMTRLPGQCYLGEVYAIDLDLGPNPGAPPYVEAHSVIVRSSWAAIPGSLLTTCIVRGFDCGDDGERSFGWAYGCALYWTHVSGHLEATNCVMVQALEVRDTGFVELIQQTYIPLYPPQVGTSEGPGKAWIEGPTCCDYYQYPLALGFRSTLRIADGSPIWFRDAAAGSLAILAQSGSAVLYAADAPPACVGVVPPINLKVGGDPHPIGDMPIVNLRNLTMIVVDE